MTAEIDQRATGRTKPSPLATVGAIGGLALTAAGLAVAATFVRILSLPPGPNGIDLLSFSVQDRERSAYYTAAAVLAVVALVAIRVWLPALRDRRRSGAARAVIVAAAIPVAVVSWSLLLIVTTVLVETLTNDPFEQDPPMELGVSRLRI